MKNVQLSVVGVFIALIIAVFPLSAEAQKASGVGVGIRSGLGLDPDQGVVGIQAVLGKKLKFMRLAPSFDFGFGDDVLTYTFNGDVRFLLLAPPKSSTALYAAAGPTISVWDPDKGETDTEIGLTLVVGIRMPFGKSNFYNLESRYGIGDVPEVRILFGVLFSTGGGSEGN
jgi:hypothetical protein